MRLFVALTPPPEVSAQFSAAIDALRSQGSGSYTPPENLHMTLVFLGETDRVTEAVNALSALTSPPFTMAPAKPGCFGNLYWAGMELSKELTSLQRETEEHLRSAGFTPEKREFIPHVTLARRFTSAEHFDLSHVENAVRGLSWPVDRVILMESRQESGRTVYLPLYTKELTVK